MVLGNKVLIDIFAQDRASPTLARVDAKLKSMEWSAMGTSAGLHTMSVASKDATEITGEYTAGTTASASALNTLFHPAVLAAAAALMVLLPILRRVVSTIKDFITDSVKTSAMFEQMGMKLEVLFDSAEAGEKAMAWIKDFARVTPYELEDVTNAFIMLSAYGVDATEKLEILGDTAAAVGRPLEQVIRAYNKFRTGQVGEAIQMFGDLGVNLRAIEGFEFDARGALVTPVAEAMPLIEEYMVDRFGGMMEKMSTTATGKWTNILDLITQIKGAIGDALLPVLKNLMDAFIELLQSVMEGQNIGDWIKAMIVPIIEYLINGLITGIKIVKNLWDIMDAWLGSITGMLKPVVQLIYDFFRTQEALQEGTGVYSDIAEGFGIIKRAIMGVFAPLQIFSELLYDLITTPIQEWGGVIDETKAKMKGLAEFIFAGRTAGQKAPGLEWEWPDLTGGGGGGGGGTKEQQQKALLALDAFELRRREYEQKRRAEAMKNAVDDAKRLVEIAKEYAEEVAEAYRRSFRKIIDKDLAKGSGAAVREGIQEGLNAAIFEGESFWRTFANKGKNYLQNLFNTIFNWLTGQLGGILQNLFAGQGAGQGGGFLGFLGGFFSGFLPGFQEPGIVRAQPPHGRVVRVAEHEAEAIAPFTMEGLSFYVSEALDRIPGALESIRHSIGGGQTVVNPVLILQGPRLGPYELYHMTENGKVRASLIEGPE